MNTSGIKRGLATTAIAALAITGVPAFVSSASAVPLSDQVTAFRILSQGGAQYANRISLGTDGTNSTVSLVASGPVAVNSVTFQYRVVGAVDQTFKQINGVVGRVDGAFTTEWAPPADVVAGSSVEIQATPNVGTPVTDTSLVEAAAVGNPSIELQSGTNLGIYTNPRNGTSNVAVRGTTSELTLPAPAGFIRVFDNDQQLDFPNAASTDATPVAIEKGTDGITRFKGVVVYPATAGANGQPYNFSGGAEVNEVALTASVDEAEDTEAYTYRTQIVTTATAAVAQNPIPVGSVTGTTAVVTVLDADGQPVAGATVDFREDVTDDGVSNPTESADAAQLTDADGKVTLTGLTKGTYSPYVDSDATGGFTAGDVTVTPFTITEFAPTNTSLVASAPGGVLDYDLDELTDAPNDFVATLRDQNQNPVANQPVEYSYTFDPSGPVGPGAPSAFVSAGNTNAQGVVNIPFTGTAAGTYTLNVRRPNVGGGGGLLNGTPITFDTAESEITFNDSSPTSSPINGSDTYTGRLALLDGLGNLGGRTVTVTYNNGGGDAQFSATQPAGSTLAAGTVTAVTAADGTFSVSLTDGAVPPNVTPTPETGVLTATADALLKTGDVTPGPADATGTLNVVFAGVVAPANTVATITPIAGGKPGVATAGTVTVTSGANNALLANQQVTLTVDKGFFTDGSNDPAPAAGADAGELRSLGTTITVVTNNVGVATFNTSIERDAGFDDDGLVKANVTASAGTGSTADTEDIDYDSANPLNGGEVQLVLSPANEQDGDTDPADVDQDVAFDVYTTDQFGNRVGNEDVDLTEDGDNADLSTSSVPSDFDDDGDFTVTSDEADDITVTASWMADTLKFTGVGNTTTPGTETLTDTADVSFDEVDFVNSTFTIVTTPEGTVPVGTVVTETVTVLDQNNDPAAGLSVEFIRGGVSGSENVVRTTNAQGQASYTFVASAQGTVSIVANITDGAGQSKTLTDSIVVGRAGKLPLNVRLTGTGNQAGADILKINTATAAAGAKVDLFKKSNGRLVFIRSKNLNTAGDAQFGVKDLNGRSRTVYRAIVRSTVDTQGSFSNIRRLF